MNKERLMEAGVNYDKGVARFMGDTELYEEVLSIFMEDDAIDRAEAAMKAENFQELFDCAHELKGASGNADMNQLFQASAELTEELRHGCKDKRKAEVLFQNMKKSYMGTKEAIRRAMEE